jgi:hypothetical protein
LIDWCIPWSTRALESVARENLSSTGALHVHPVLLRLCVAMHRSVEDRMIKILAETKRLVAITPSGYFKLLPVFQTQIEQHRQANAAQIAHYKTDVETIQTALRHIAQMSE